MRNRYAHVVLILLLAQDLSAQYCSPTFANGCFSWRTLEVQAGSINWAPGADDCSLSDYTTLSTTVDAGTMLPMRVLNGTWCGCAVWVDWNQSNSFEDSENMYFIYVGGSPSYEYQFGITIPLATATGAYRMRIISPWGSDGFHPARDTHPADEVHVTGWINVAYNTQLTLTTKRKWSSSETVRQMLVLFGPDDTTETKTVRAVVLLPAGDVDRCLSVDAIAAQGCLRCAAAG